MATSCEIELRVNHNHLYYIVNYQQDDWMDILSLAKFTYNNTMHSSQSKLPSSLTMQIAIRRYISIFTLEITCAFYDFIVSFFRECLI